MVEDFHTRLAIALDAAGFPPGRGRTAALARKYEVSDESARKWLTGEATPTMKKQQAMARDFRVHPEWLIAGLGAMPYVDPVLVVPGNHDIAEKEVGLLISENSADAYNEKYVFVDRVKGPKLSAGKGELLWDFEEIDKSHAFRRDYMQSKGWKAARCKLWDVQGDSMATTLNHGDTVMINLADREIISGEIYALIAGDGLRVKRLIRRADGIIEMRSDNPQQHKYPPEPITDTNAAVIGRVVWRAGSFV